MSEMLEHYWRCFCKELFNQLVAIRLKASSDTKVGPSYQSPIHLDDLQRSHGLTTRETDITRLLLQGSSYKEIAATLYISVKTVAKHVQNIYKKIAVSSRGELFYKLLNYKAGDSDVNGTSSTTMTP